MQIQVTFEIDSNGIVNVSATDLETGQKTSTTINLSSGLSEQDLQKAMDDNAAVELAHGGPRRPWPRARTAWTPQFLIEVETLAAVLDQLDYFGVLKIPQTATPAEIKAAYYRESRAYHPDRYAALALGRAQGDDRRASTGG